MRFTKSLAIVGILTVMGISATSRGAVFHYQASLDGPSEFPANTSSGTGAATFDYDDVAHTFHVHVTFQGLTGTTTASHIHSPVTSVVTPTAGVATTLPTFAGFPLGVTAGTYDNILDLTQASSWNSAYVNGRALSVVEAGFITEINAGQAYLNIHTTDKPGGEIRGFLSIVPEPGSLSLLAGAGVLLLARKRR